MKRRSSRSTQMYIYWFLVFFVPLKNSSVDMQDNDLCSQLRVTGIFIMKDVPWHRISQSNRDISRAAKHLAVEPYLFYRLGSSRQWHDFRSIACKTNANPIESPLQCNISNLCILKIWNKNRFSKNPVGKMEEKSI